MCSVARGFIEISICVSVLCELPFVRLAFLHSSTQGLMSSKIYMSGNCVDIIWLLLQLGQLILIGTSKEPLGPLSMF